jgi:hypothetical protein
MKRKTGIRINPPRAYSDIAPLFASNRQPLRRPDPDPLLLGSPAPEPKITDEEDESCAR